MAHNVKICTGKKMNRTFKGEIRIGITFQAC